ncbi:alpha/beta fold hydrolase [Pedobacter sp. UBA5917]|jgi:pimeloyl-ACP methyl ester carboxylesterase|uniref:alpha/beta fold hydrolase n=1 Tax=Pedobacter sp. UBA5917 TaxID=1947061 RepID=UPI0025F65DB5|nr:alpha/beta hydrolase [Pedobacter sp. UBA5917]
MKISTLLALCFVFFNFQAFSQSYIPKIESTGCKIKTENGVIAKCGYLVVPENRANPSKNLVKIPFIFVRKQDQDSVKNISLYTTGGPGYSTTLGITQIGLNSGFLRYGGFIAFDQRGTKLAIPSLQCPEVDQAIKRSYLENLSKDSLVKLAVTSARKRFTAKGIDLSAYNTTESAADISDLKKVLKIESMMLVGISYSGGLMLTVAKNHPEGIKALILNSPLPGFVNYEEHALINMNEALDQVFDNVQTDSTKTAYKDLKQRFHDYFTKISSKRFNMRYLPKENSDSITISYGKTELLDAVFGKMENGTIKIVPFVMNEIINGKHQQYITEVVDGAFSGDPNRTLGMRYSIYCPEQIAYSDPKLIAKQDKILPWLSGYPFNNVNKEICDCWKVNSQPASIKEPVYSNIPALISAGDADPFCRPFYNKLIKRYMPNAQLLIIHNRAHGAGFGNSSADYLGDFLADPYKKLVSKGSDVRIE